MTVEEQKDENLLTMIHQHQNIDKLTDDGKDRVEELKKIRVEELTKTQSAILYKTGAINEEMYDDHMIFHTLKAIHKNTNLFEPERQRFDQRDFYKRLVHLRSMNPFNLNVLHKKILEMVNLIPVKLHSDENDILNSINEAIKDKSSLTQKLGLNIDGKWHLREYLDLLKAKTEGLTEIQKQIAQALHEYEKIKPQW